MLHAGNAALALGVWRMLKVSAVVTPQHVVVSGTGGRDLGTLLLYGVTAYLLLIAWLRGSRRDVLTSIVVHQAALTLLVWERTSADVFILFVAAGWHFLIALHVLSWWPRLRFVLIGVAYLLLVSWCYDFTDVHWFARANATTITLGLFVAGMFWRWTGYCRIAGYTAICHMIFYPARELSDLTSPIEAACIMGAFALLASGGILSWNKQILLYPVNQNKLNSISDEPDSPKDNLGF